MSTVVNNRTRELSPRSKARLAGLFYLLTGGTAFAYSVRGKLIVAGSAAATANHILSHETLFREALIADLLGVACYLVVTALFYELFKPVSRQVSLLAAFFGLIGCTVQVVACGFHLGALVLLRGAQDPGMFEVQQSQTLAFTLLKLHGATFAIAILWLGIYCLLIGYLVFQSRFLPRTLGVLMALGGIGYITNTLTTFLSPALGMHLAPIATALGGIGEGVLLLWLLIMGVDEEKWKDQAKAAAAFAGL